MLSGKVKRERRKNNNGSNSKKAAKKCTFFVHFFAFVLHKYNVKLP